jgi:hypothetical protein
MKEQEIREKLEQIDYDSTIPKDKIEEIISIISNNQIIKNNNVDDKLDVIENELKQQISLENDWRKKASLFRS